ncbi:MAG: gas vesicle protein GvpN [Pseudomonadota bacterium]
MATTQNIEQKCLSTESFTGSNEEDRTTLTDQKSERTSVRQISSNVVSLKSDRDIFLDTALSSIIDRTLVYLRSGIPVHLRGPAGAGKTTLALQAAARLNRPAVLMSGDSCLSSQDLVGKETGTRSRRVVDKFIHSVQKTELETVGVWVDKHLTTAVLNGYTLVYDEFTRSPANANNALLTALEERRLIVPGRSDEETLIEAHPEFRVIFTSNPDDYAGVEVPQDALIDRMITLDVASHSVDTEAGIISVRSGLDIGIAKRIALLVRRLRAETQQTRTSVRSSIMIAKVVAANRLNSRMTDAAFVQLCIDALFSQWSQNEEVANRAKFITELANALRSIDIEEENL